MKLLKDYAVLASGQITGRLLGFLAFAWLRVHWIRKLTAPSST